MFHNIRSHHCLAPHSIQPDALVDYSGFQANDIIEVARVVASKVSEEAATCSRRELISVKRKYEGDRYDNVSREYRDPDVSLLCP